MPNGSEDARHILVLPSLNINTMQNLMHRASLINNHSLKATWISLYIEQFSQAAKGHFWGQACKRVLSIFLYC